MTLKLWMPHQAFRRNVYNLNSMLFLRAEWRRGVAAGMWEKIQYVCTDVYACVCAHWTWGPHSARFPVASAPFSIMAEYESILVWGCSPHWLPLSPGTSASKEGGEPCPVDVDHAHSCSWSVAGVVLGVLTGPSSHRAPRRWGTTLYTVWQEELVWEKMGLICWCLGDPKTLNIFQCL